MCLVIVKFTTLYCSTVIDGRLPFAEIGSTSAVYLIPEPSAVAFSKIALESENVKSATVYRHWKTFK